MATLDSANGTSATLAPAFIVSAPGKTIVYGEHAVVHGKAAIAAAISLRSYLLVTTLPSSSRTITLRFSDIGLDHTWDIADLPWKVFEQKRKGDNDLITALDPELVEAMQPHIEAVGKGEEEGEKKKIHQAAASAFLYLFLSLGSPSHPGTIYALRSTIPIGAGLGSSASVSVCIATALLIQSHTLSGPHPDQQSQEAEAQLQRINRWAFVGEMLIHGNPSGVDNTVATNGHAVLFQRTDPKSPPKVEILREFPELPLLLIDTCQAKSTAAEVAKVGALKKRHPAVVEGILSSIDAITRSVYEKISEAGFDATEESGIAHLGELMEVNHALLASLGVSHPRLERLRTLVGGSGVGWTKLTGAGGGGCAITLLKPGVLAGKGGSGDALKELDVKLEEEGFVKYQTTLGGDGVGVLSPAVLRGKEIDLEGFLKAEGREGVEGLVGGEGGAEGEGWRYWRP
ncbi:unnamed protein product [Zymoseptoria tritici ST99CH_3D1]|nr:unnamed protein product [Zymoseptoria tritici ST99CH_3D1]